MHGMLRVTGNDNACTFRAEYRRLFGLRRKGNIYRNWADPLTRPRGVGLVLSLLISPKK